LDDLEPYRFRLLLLGIVVLMTAETLAAESGGGAVLGPAGVLALAAMLFALARQRWVFFTALGLAMVSTGGLIGGGSAGFAGSGFHAPLFCFTAGVITTHVLRSERADGDTIVGSLCAYLLVALAFASLYAALEATQPGSFAFGGARSDARLFRELYYFSLVTISTLGYGDITPVASGAIALVSLESVIGILFPSIVVARIVSLAVSGGGRPFALEDLGLRRAGRFELLVGVGILGLLLAPFPEREGVGQVVLGVIGTAILLAALYAASASTWRRTLGNALAVGALACLWWPAPAGSPIERAGLGLELAFFAFVVGSLARWLLREQRVTRDVLLASVGLYLLLGFTWARAFGLAEAITPGSVEVPASVALHPGLLTYYSFMTLTTTGFGDFAPGTPLVERLATLESLVGVFYPAILVAKLVSLYQSD
jgi:hypothetical protein